MRALLLITVVLMSGCTVTTLSYEDHRGGSHYGCMIEFEGGDDESTACCVDVRPVGGV